MSLWSAPFLGGSDNALSEKVSGHLNASVSIPGSKSLTNRYLILAALSAPRPGSSPIRLTAPLVARDTLLMVQALESLGVCIERGEGDAFWDIYPPEHLHAGDIDCGLAGTVMRFIPPVAALADGVSVLDGDAEARLRPMGAVIDGLRQLGIQITQEESSQHLPIAVCGSGEVSGGAITIDASASSQFVSGLLLAGARFKHGLDLQHCGGELPSLPHISMTVQTLRAAGVQVTELPADFSAQSPVCGVSSRSDLSGSNLSGSDLSVSVPAARSRHRHAVARWVVEPGSICQPDIIIEPDLSNAAPFLAAAMVAGGRVRIPHWPVRTTQPGAQLPHIFEQMGGRARFYRGNELCGRDRAPSGDHAAAGTLEISGPCNGSIKPLDMDLHAVGELVPSIAAVAAFAEGASRLRNIGQLRGHETNRLAAIVEELSKVGVDAWEDGDDLVIAGHCSAGVESSSPDSLAKPLTSVTIESYADHRMATFGAILGLRIPRLSVHNIETTAKTLPTFVPLWEAMLEESGAE